MNALETASYSTDFIRTKERKPGRFMQALRAAGAIAVGTVVLSLAPTAAYAAEPLKTTDNFEVETNISCPGGTASADLLVKETTIRRDDGSQITIDLVDALYAGSNGAEVTATYAHTTSFSPDGTITTSGLDTRFASPDGGTVNVNAGHTITSYSGTEQFGRFDGPQNLCSLLGLTA